MKDALDHAEFVKKKLLGIPQEDEQKPEAQDKDDKADGDDDELSGGAIED